MTAVTTRSAISKPRVSDPALSTDEQFAAAKALLERTMKPLPIEYEFIFHGEIEQ